MNRFVKKTSIKILSGIAFFIVFIYLTAIICSMPLDFSVSIYNYKVISNYSIKDITDITNANLSSILKGEISKSFKGENQFEIIKGKTIRTIGLLAGGILLGFLIGVIRGVIDGRRKSSFNMLLTIIPISLPDLLVIGLLQYLAIVLYKHGINIFKVAGQGTIKHMLLPIIALSILPSSYLARIIATSIKKCYNEEYVKVARGKGCSEIRILWNHVMRNAMRIAFEGLSNITSMIICNLLLVEFLFSYKGIIGSLVVSRIETTTLIIVIVILGLIYFILDSIFQFLKNVIFKPIREEGI